MLKSKTKKIMAAAAGMLLLCSVAAAETAGLQTVTKAGSNATVQANPKNFTGTAWATSLFSAHSPSKTYAAVASFTPGARTNLHIHSTASDGTFSPTEIVNKALKLTEKDSPVVIALTDHDTVAGIDEFQKAAAKHKDRLTAISGLEISTDYHGVEIHVLGYNLSLIHI